MPRKLRVVQIGTAHDHAADHVDTIRALNQDYELVGVCEPDEELREAAKLRISCDGTYRSYADVCWLTMEEILGMEDLDAAIIETGELDLVRYAQQIADKGLPIHMDKPCGENYGEFRHLVDTMREKKLPLHIGYMYRYNEAVKYCRQLKEEGKLGEIFAVEAQMSVLHDAQKRQWLKRFKGGMMFFLGCHLVDIVYSMCGECEDILPLNTSTHNEGVDSDDYGFAVFRYRNGVSFVKACASEVNGFGRRQIVVTGTKGSVVIEPIEQRTGGPQVETYVTAHVTFYDEGIQHRFGNSGTDMTFGPFGRYTEMMEDFAQIVRGERENRFSYEDELAVQRMLLKACGNWKGENQ